MSVFACENAILQEIDASKEIGILFPISFAGCRKYFFDTLRAGTQRSGPHMILAFLEEMAIMAPWTEVLSMQGASVVIT